MVSGFLSLVRRLNMNKEKECTHCHQFKLSDKFGSDRSKSDGLTCTCKVCRNKLQRDKYANDPEFRKHKIQITGEYQKDKYVNDPMFKSKQDKSTKKSQKARREKRIELLNKIKIDAGCAICGYNKCGSKIDFHHLVEDEKVDNVSHMLDRKSYENILKELEKCNILCDHCHTQLHKDGLEYLKQLNEGD